MSGTTWRAPGRVNLIGEHTDYNGGLALPFAIGLGCTARVLPSETYAVSSAQQPSPVLLDGIADLPDADVPVWVRYALGPLWVLRERGHAVPPLEVTIDSDVPSGSGLSSSAAVVCSVTAAVADHLGLALPLEDLVAISRAAENDVVGAPTGGLDQMASLGCREGHALLIDFATMRTEQVPLPLADAGLTILVLDTMVRHSHADGEYAARRAGCAAGVPAYLRHVRTENQRVRDVVDLLRSGRLDEIGPLLSASHASLRDDYEVTTPELDLAAATLEAAGALGARMTGGGFGGCVIGLVAASRADACGRAVAAAFEARGWEAPRWFTAEAGPGAYRLSAEG
ncbi:MAG TPA: galactokinase family protein [Nocardioides sp.]|nr:galactokinase family protein [Nocardioides sp.]